MILVYNVLEIWCVTNVTVTFHFGILSALYPPNGLKNKNLNKIKKTPGHIILHKCTKNHDHMLYCS